MPKNVSTQWEFKDLFEPAAPTRQILTVGALTAKVRSILERQVGQVWVTGEVSNLRVQSSGHRYFTLKDADAQLSCVLFRGEPVAHRDYISDGQKLLLQGDLTVYEARGQYQLIVRAVELQGVGALQLAFEQLKKKLQAEGLFAQERKRPLPRYPRRIGLVTSPTGAAIRDILHVIRRRQPGLELILASCRVQGEEAAQEIACGIELLNAWARSSADTPGAPDRHLDLILVTRGGGSLEDLWAFNEEVVARAIYNSAIPVVSAVGHEIDFTISDFVADLRAATPSAAAEIITEGAYASRQYLAETAVYLRQLMRRALADQVEKMNTLGGRLSRVHPRRILREQQQYVDDLQQSMLRCGKQDFRRLRTAWQELHQRLARLRPSLMLRQRREVLDQLERRLLDQGKYRTEQARQKVESLAARLRLLSPEHVLARGYSITLDEKTGAVVRRASAVRSGQKLLTKVQDGEIRSVVDRGKAAQD